MSTIIAMVKGPTDHGGRDPGRVMISDSGISLLNTVMDGPRKIWKSRRTGSLLGLTGASAAIPLFHKWYEEGNQDRSVLPLLSDADAGGFTVLELTSKNDFFIWFADCVALRLPRRGRRLGKFMAIGSGTPYALGALEAGASAQKAIGVAIKYDPDSFGVTRQIWG